MRSIRSLTTRPSLARAAAVGAVALALAAVPTAASAKPDTGCMQNGIAALKAEEGRFAAVARDGLPISAAVALGVTVRPGASLAGVPDPLPLSVVLADHRAGDDSLFLYPWCD